MVMKFSFSEGKIAKGKSQQSYFHHIIDNAYVSSFLLKLEKCNFKGIFVLFSLRNGSLLIPGTGEEGNIIFSQKKLVTHPTFTSKFSCPI